MQSENYFDLEQAAEGPKDSIFTEMLRMDIFVALITMLNFWSMQYLWDESALVHILNILSLIGMLLLCIIIIPFCYRGDKSKDVSKKLSIWAFITILQVLLSLELFGLNYIAYTEGSTHRLALFWAVIMISAPITSFMRVNGKSKDAGVVIWNNQFCMC